MPATQAEAVQKCRARTQRELVDNFIPREDLQQLPSRVFIDAQVLGKKFGELLCRTATLDRRLALILLPHAVGQQILVVQVADEDRHLRNRQQAL